MKVYKEVQGHPYPKKRKYVDVAGDDAKDSGWEDYVRDSVCFINEASCA